MQSLGRERRNVPHYRATEARALEAATGKLLWQYDPFEGMDEDNPRGVNRGVAYWESGNDQRIFFVARARLMAFDARTGKLIRDFGQGGSVDLKRGLGRDIERIDLRRHLARHHLQEPDHPGIDVRRRARTLLRPATFAPSTCAPA